MCCGWQGVDACVGGRKGMYDFDTNALILLHPRYERGRDAYTQLVNCHTYTEDIERTNAQWFET